MTDKRSKTKTKTDTAIEVATREPSKKLLSMINEWIDTGLKFTKLIKKIWDQGTKEGFTWDEIAEIIRPIAHKKRLDKDQVFYLTHYVQIQEKNKKYYQELKLKKENRINPTTEQQQQEELPAQVQALAEIEATTAPTEVEKISTETEIPRAEISPEELEPLTETEVLQLRTEAGPCMICNDIGVAKPIGRIKATGDVLWRIQHDDGRVCEWNHKISELQPIQRPSATIAVQNFSLNDLDKYDSEFLIQIVHYLYNKLEQLEQQIKQNEEKARQWDKDQASMKKFLVRVEKLSDTDLGMHFRRWTQGATFRYTKTKSKPKSKPNSRKSD